jgi:Tripartite tricarboxylate transporter TctB family
VKANLTLLFLVIFIVAAFVGWDWPNIAKIMPVYVAAIPGLVLVLIQLYREVTDWEARRAASGMEMDQVSEVTLDQRTELLRTVGFFGWFIGGALGIWLLGIVITLPILVFLYALIEGKEKWFAALIMGVCTYLVIWGLFEYMLETRWPPGMLFGY